MTTSAHARIFVKDAQIRTRRSTVVQRQSMENAKTWLFNFFGPQHVQIVSDVTNTTFLCQSFSCLLCLCIRPRDCMRYQPSIVELSIIFKIVNKFIAVIIILHQGAYIYIVQLLILYCM